MYIKRDTTGAIVAISHQSAPGFSWLEDTAPELQAFIQGLARVRKENTSQLVRTDAELARVLEDVIDLLTHKGVIQFTELPSAAQEKLLKRKHFRQNVDHLKLLDDDNEGTIKL